MHGFGNEDDTVGSRGDIQYITVRHVYSGLVGITGETLHIWERFEISDFFLFLW